MKQSNTHLPVQVEILNSFPCQADKEEGLNGILVLDLDDIALVSHFDLIGAVALVYEPHIGSSGTRFSGRRRIPTALFVYPLG